MDQSIRTINSTRSCWTTDDVRNKIEKSKVVVFAKGTPDHPRCGFTERVFMAIQRSGKPYEVIDCYEDRSIVAALKAYSGEQHLPMVYVNGELISSSDNQAEVLHNGELDAKVEEAFKQ